MQSGKQASNWSGYFRNAILASDIGVLGDEATVIDAIHHAKEKVTEENIQRIIEELFHVNISSENLKRTISSLHKQNKLCREGQCLVISPQTLEEITKVALENEKIETEALLGWINYNSGYGSFSRDFDNRTANIFSYY